MPNVVLAGFKGVGKTTVGKGLADKLGRTFIDLDDEIENLYEKQEGERLGFRDVFKRVGGAAFRSLEFQAAAALLEHFQKADHKHILSVGGHALTVPETAKTLREIGPVVCLTAPFEEILERIKAGGVPAYVDPEAMEEDLRDMFDKRLPILKKQADLIIDIAGLGPDAAIDKVSAEIAQW